MGINDQEYRLGDIGIHILPGGAMLACLGIEDQDGAGQVLGDIVLVVEGLSHSSKIQCLGDAATFGLELLECGHRLTSISFSC